MALFGKKKEPTDVLRFKSNEAAFEYACRFLQTSLIADANLYSLVVKPPVETDQPIAVDERGIQTCLLKVCDDQRGFTTMAQTAGRKGPRLNVGDGVIWRPIEKLGDTWIGLILAKVEPSLSMTQGWKLVDLFQE